MLFVAMLVDVYMRCRDGCFLSLLLPSGAFFVVCCFPASHDSSVSVSGGGICLGTGRLQMQPLKKNTTTILSSVYKTRREAHAPSNQPCSKKQGGISPQR